MNGRPTKTFLFEGVSNPEVDVPESALARIEVARLRHELRLLPVLERRVLELRFGLNGRERLTKRETARQLCMSGGRVFDLERRALARLREAHGFGAAPGLGEAA